MKIHRESETLISCSGSEYAGGGGLKGSPAVTQNIKILYMKYYKLLCIKTLYIILFGISTLPATAQDGNLLQRADSLFEHHHESEALRAYREVLERDPDHFTALWRVSILQSRIGKRQEETAAQREYFENAKAFAEKALAVDSTRAESNFVMAVAMGRMALISSARDRVAASREIKKYADRTLQIDSSHAGAWHLLGRWNFQIANLNFVERLAANTLFGGIPGEASNQKAAEYIERATRLDDRFILYQYDLARVYREMGRPAEAREACSEALEMPLRLPEDEQLKAQCRDLMNELE